MGHQKKQRNASTRQNFKKNTKKKQNTTQITPIFDDLIFGTHSVLEALKEKKGTKLWIQKDIHLKRSEELKTLATEYSVPIQWVPKERLDELTQGAVHQGVVLQVTPYQYLTLSELLSSLSPDKDHRLLILDGIVDPHNLGAILRTADASGIDGVILPKHRSVGITSTVVKVATGAVEHVLIARVTNLTQAINTLKESGFWIYGTDVSGVPFTKWNTQGSIALVIGNEGKGISAQVKKEVDDCVMIPMTGHVQSLNASVAAGILMYEMQRDHFSSSH